MTLTEWKALLHGRPDKKWNQPGFDASAWSTVQNGNIGSWSQNGIYFLHHFTLDNGDAYPIVEFGVYYKGRLRRVPERQRGLPPQPALHDQLQHARVRHLRRRADARGERRPATC